MPESENLLQLTQELFSEIEALKIANTEISVQLQQMIVEVSEIKSDRRGSGDKYQTLIQRLTTVEVLIKSSQHSIASMEGRFDKTFENVEHRLNNAVISVETRLEKGVEDIEKRIEKRVDELFSDKKFWVQSLITCVLSILGSCVVAYLITHAGK